MKPLENFALCRPVFGLADELAQAVNIWVTVGKAGCGSGSVSQISGDILYHLYASER
jgi:hypothetical protein